MSNQTIVIIFILVLVAVSLFLIFKNKNATAPVKTNSITPKTGGSATTIVKSVFPLQQGKSGQEVKDLQNYLNDNYNAGLTVDGNFGTKTSSALHNYMGETSMSEAEYNNLFTVDQYSNQFNNGDTSNTDNPDPFSGTAGDAASQSNPCPWYLSVIGYCY